MIDVKGLRIGVTVFWNGEIKTIKNWVELANATDPSTNLLIEPIPLSKDILEKCGFEKCSCGGYKNGIHISKNDLGEIYYKGMILKYLHQLQNLYYALTSEELEIKL